jgi:hypothetical protein
MPQSEADTSVLHSNWRVFFPSFHLSFCLAVFLSVLPIFDVPFVSFYPSVLLSILIVPCRPYTVLSVFSCSFCSFVFSSFCPFIIPCSF